MNISKNNIGINSVKFGSQKTKLENTKSQQNIETKKDGKKLLLLRDMATAAIGSAMLVISKGKKQIPLTKKVDEKQGNDVINNLPKKTAVETPLCENDVCKTEKIVDETVENIDIVDDKEKTKTSEVADGKNEEMEILADIDPNVSAQERLALAEAKFKELHRKNLPTPEERFQILIDEGIEEGIIKKYELDTENSFLSRLWNKTSLSEQLRLDAKLESFTECEMVTFEKVKDILRKNGIEYDELDVATSLGTLRFLPENLVFENGSIAFHAEPYAYNNCLREAPTDETIGGLSRKILDKGFENVEPLKEEITVYRGITAQDYQSVMKKFVQDVMSKKQGETFSDAGFSYSSYDEDMAKTFAGNGTVLEIKVPKGAKVSSSRYSSQKEVLFPRNAEFKVLEEVKIKDGYSHMVVEYVLPKN